MLNAKKMEDYRFGFETQEKDNETQRSGVLEGKSFKIKYTEKIKGTGNSLDFGARIYDSRLGRRWNMDPKPNPSVSQYVAFEGNPISFNDIQGDSVGVQVILGKIPDKYVQRESTALSNADFNVINDYMYSVTGVKLANPEAGDIY